MNLKNIARTQALLNLIGAIGLMIWWFSMPIFLPVANAENNFQAMVLDNDWILINLAGLISTLFMTLGFPGLYLHEHKKFSRAGFAAMIMALAGLILFTSIQYYETILWPAAANIHSELVHAKGALVSGDPGVITGLIFSGILLGLGFILFGLAAMRAKAYPRLPLWFLILGAPLFGNAVIFPARTAGLILFCTGMIWLSLHIRRAAVLNPSTENQE
jgi:hypothetical protein